MARLHFRGHIGKRDYAVNTSPPTISGSAISGQTLTRGAGTWTTVESTNVGFAYVWQSADAPLFENWTDIVGATNTTLLLSGTHIGKKLRVGEARINGDGQAPFVYSQPTLVVQDAPAVPLSITGTPRTSANQNDPVSFIVSFDGGSGTYTPSLLNAPAGSSVTMLSNGDQATVTLGTANVGSFGNIIVRVGDGVVTADLAAFTFTVNAIGSIQTVIPGGGWGGLTTTVNGVSVTAARGSAANRGYGFQPTCFFEEPPFFDIDSPYVLWIHAYHTGPIGDFDSNHPTFGIEKVTVAADGGAWLTITAQYNAAEDFWGFPVRIDPAQWADGYPTLGASSVRTLRIVAWPYNGTPRVLQTEPPDYFQSFRFTTNAGGTFTRAKRYFGSNGSAGNDGLTSSTPKLTMEQAAATFTPGAGRNYGDLELVCTGGTSLDLTLNARTTTVRPLKVSALPGLTASQCIFTSQGGSGTATKLTHFKGLGLNLIVKSPSSSALYFEDPALDGGSGNTSADVTYHTTSASWGVWIRGGTLTNYGNAFRGTRSAVNTNVGTVGRNFIQDVLISRGVRLGNIPVSGGVHPDTFQYYKTPTNVAGDGWFYGGLAINCVVDNADAQGPFIKDNNYCVGIFMIGCHFTLGYTGRNTFYIGTYLNGGVATPEVLQNSMFWDCVFEGGNSSRGAGICQSVIFHNTTMPGSFPSGSVVY